MRIANPLGKKGEDIAVNFLKKKGYQILERNYRKQYAEIDIIALSSQKDILVFIEVKTRSSTVFGTPFESITFRKLKPVIKLAQLYAALHPKLPQSLRIDAISIQVAGENAEVIHEENISGF